MSKPFINDQKEIYVTTVNVPKSLTITDQFTFFVEIRAKLFEWDGKRPVFTVEINNANISMVSAIDWNKFVTYIEELVANHYEIIYEVK